MGLFSSDESETDVPDERIEELVNNAQSDTVTEERLTKADTTGIASRGIDLDDDPIIEYLGEDEQPHFIFFTSKTISPIKLPDTGAELSHIKLATSAFCITDSQVVLILNGVPDGGHPDKSVGIPLDKITGFELKPTSGELGMDAHAIDVQVESDIMQEICDVFDEDHEDFKNAETVRLMAINAFDESDIEEAGEYLNDALDLDSSSKSRDGGELSNIDVDSIINDAVPDKYLSKIDESIRPDETVHYAYPINAAERGEDHMGGYTTGGCLLATDRRLTAYIKETIGSSNLSIGYDKIDTVEIEHGAMITKLSIQSTSKTYTFPGFNSIDKSEIHEFADFIRDQASESKTDDGSASTNDPTEQLKNIKELHEEGVLTDEEFESKKQELLDDI